MTKKLRLLLVQGDPSNEHAISLASGKMVLSVLDKGKYDCIVTTIQKNGKLETGYIHQYQRYLK